MTLQPSFSTSFWGDHNKGLEVLLVRMKQGKHLSEEVHAMLKERSSMEEDYGKRLSKLAKTFNPRDELGTLRESLDVVRLELERSARAHLDLANELRAKLEKPLHEFITTQSGLRKSHQRVLEKHLSSRTAQENLVMKYKERYEARSLEASQMYLMAMQGGNSKEAEKIRAKYEKTLTQSKQYEQDYRSGVDRYGDIHRNWQADMTAACIDYQKMEEDRFQFIRGNIWNYTNFLSGICVAEDESCERIRVSLEKCDFAKDLALFLGRYSTGSEIPKPLSYIPFMEGSVSSGIVGGGPGNALVTQAYSPTPPLSSTASRPSSIMGVFSSIGAGFTSARASISASSAPQNAAANTSTHTTPSASLSYASVSAEGNLTLGHDRHGSNSTSSFSGGMHLPSYDPNLAAFDNPHTQLALAQTMEREKANGRLVGRNGGDPYGNMPPLLSSSLAPTSHHAYGTNGAAGESAAAVVYGDTGSYPTFHYHPFDVPESVQILFSVRALYDYDSGAPEELTVLKGQVIPVIATHEDGWWEGLGSEDGKRRKGLFPSNFTESIILQ
ncbi:hypothetical protein BASA81_006942 [Batrachochytrium salamandrivorans]|nr:hypothetical protein BASA81_006942 [Batrachochytrium salamandrivorans]